MRKFYVLLVFLSVASVAMPSFAQSDDVQGTLNDIVRDYVENDSAIVVQVTTPDNTWVATGGLARPDQPTTPTDRFRIASMSKTYVAALTLLLVEEGYFELDDLASEWLPDEIVENIANADEVTLRHLLSMRSGIPDYLGTDAFWETVEDDPTYTWTVENSLAYAYNEPALFAPDEAFDYSNSNYLLMQLVLEAATEEPLHVLMREYILDPLGLDNTYTQISETLPGGFVDSYTDIYGDGNVINASLVNDGAGLADGGLISTVEDVTTFYQALLYDETLLSEASFDELLSFSDDDEAGGYSLGLILWETEYGDAIGHSGGVLGFASIGIYLEEADVIIVVLAANEALDLESILEDIIEVLE